MTRWRHKHDNRENKGQLFDSYTTLYIPEIQMIQMESHDAKPENFIVDGGKNTTLVLALPVSREDFSSLLFIVAGIISR